MTDAAARVVAYHDGTKHHYHRFARALGYLDWASQPKPFRSFHGARAVPLFPAPGAEQPGSLPPAVATYDALYADSPGPPLAMSPAAIGYFLRHALGLSAWKVYRASRWSLRVNPSSGNLHPTEAYLIADRRVWHYAADRHALEERCLFAEGAWATVQPPPDAGFLVALTSIHWREAWKYGERAFRYCQHDVGHAIAALRLAAALCGWRATVLPAWDHEAIAALTGVERDQDYIDAEREDPACVMLVTAGGPSVLSLPVSDPLLSAIRNGRWSGRASQLSEDHVQWTFIDEVAAATAGPIQAPAAPAPLPPWSGFSALPGLPGRSGTSGRSGAVRQSGRALDAPTVILQRRSAVALDSISALDRATFLHMLARVMPVSAAPWDALWWTPRIHLVLFVHRVTGVEPGVYLLARHQSSETLLRSAMTRDFSWDRVVPELPLWRLIAGDHRMVARRVSCDQDIAADGFFSVGMLAELDAGLRDHGAPFYRHLFWESGVVGQVLYLEAEAAGARGTGIGCFYDDGVHELLGIRDHAVQSLYHFTIGMPVEDGRLTTEPGYAWERAEGGVDTKDE